MTDTPSTASTHRDFHWIDGSGQRSSYATFVETTLDISAGIHTCLQLIYASELERAANRDADPGDSVIPAISEREADKLMRLAIAAADLLRDEALRRVERFNRGSHAANATLPSS